MQPPRAPPDAWRAGRAAHAARDVPLCAGGLR
jgi:hypothetical protein